MDQQQYAAPPAAYSNQHQHQYAPQQQVQLAAAGPWTGAGPYQQQPGGCVQTLPAYQEAPHQQQQQQQWQQPVVYQQLPQQQLAPTYPEQQQQPYSTSAYTNQYAAPPAEQQQQAAGGPPQVAWGNQQPLQPQLWPGAGQQQQQVHYQQSMQQWQPPAPGPQQQFHQQQQYPSPQQQQQWAGGAGSAAAGGQLAQLGSDQLKAINAVQQGHCVFLTGGAGVGKSFTVEALVQMLQDKGRPEAVTASTGTAALNANGMTIHSWAGILDFRQHPVELAEKLWGWDKWMAQWEHADVLVLDEISMVDCDLLDKVDYLGRYMRGWRITQHSLYGGLFVHELHPLPFGGLQVIAVGDFFQLPPVDKDDTWDAKPVREQEPAKGAKERLPPGTVIQKVPLVMALLPPEAVDAHVEARAAKLAKNTVEARDLEYQMHYGVRPVRQQQQQQQQQQFLPLAPQQQQQPQQYGGFAAPGAAAAAAAGGGWVDAAGDRLAPPYGCMQPQTALQLLHSSAPHAAAAAQQGHLPGAAAGAQGAAAAPSQPAINQEVGPQQQQLLVRQERLECALQSPSPYVQQQQQQEEEQQEPLSPLLPTQVFPDVSGVQQQPGEGFFEPPLKRRRTADAERLDLQQQPQLTFPGAQGPRSSADAGSDAAAAVKQPAAAGAAAAGAGSSARLSGSPDEDDLSYDAISAAIQQAECQSRSQQQAASPLQQRSSQWLSPQQQQQQPYGTPPRAAAASQSSPHSGTPYHSARSVPRSALSALQLMSQAPLPFGDSFGTQQQQQRPAAGDAAANAAATQARVDSIAGGLLPCTQQDLDLGDKYAGSRGHGATAGGGLGVVAAAGAAAVVAAAAVPLPDDSPMPGVGHGAAGQDASNQGTQADVPAVDSAADSAAAAAGPAAGRSDAAAPPGSPEVVVLDSQDVAAAGTADPAGLDLTLGSPAGSQGAAAAAGAGAGSEVIEILDTDSPPATPHSSSPIDLTMTPLEDYDDAASKATGQQLGAAAAAAPAAACGAGLGQQERAQQQSGWLCAALFCGDQPEPASAAVAVAAAAGSSAHVQQQQPHQHQQQQQVWQPHQQHTWQQQQQGWSGQQHQRPLMPPPGTISPATGLRHLSIGQGNPAGSANSAAAAAAAAAVAASAAANSSNRRSSRYTHLLQMLERAANMPLTPPASPRRAAAEAAAAAAAAGGEAGINPERYHDKNQREARDVCGCLFSRGLARSRLFEVKEVTLGHVYGRSNGRMKEAWQAGSLIHPKLHETRPEGYDWSPTSSHSAAAAAASNSASGFNRAGGVEPAGSASAGSGGGAGGSSGGARRPLHLSMSPARAAPPAAAGGSGGSGAAAGFSRWDVPRLPVQFLKPAPTSTEYCFKSPVWAATKFKPVILREAYRQSDPELLDALNQLRLGSMTERTCCLLSECKRPLPDDGIGATHLFPVKKDANKVNKREYDSLSGPELLYASMDTCDPHVYSQAALESRLDKSTNAPRVVRLKPGTQVLLLSNVDMPGGLANGTRGVVEGFVSTREYLKQELVRFPTQMHAGRDQSNTSMQGTVQSGCDGYSSGAGRPGHPQHPGYVDQAAAFPAANLHPVCGKCTVPGCPCQQPAWSELVVNRQTQSITVKAKLLDADEPETLELPSDKRRREQLQQAIMFTVSKRCGGVSVAPWADTGLGSGSGGSGSVSYKWLIVGPRRWQQKANTRDHFGVTLERVQVPLLHAWAISIHKSQGMSISKLVVNVQRSFTAGMVYTALSRCTSRDGLQIVGDVPAPQSSNDVRTFYQYLFSIEGRDS